MFSNDTFTSSLNLTVNCNNKTLEPFEKKKKEKRAVSMHVIISRMSNVEISLISPHWLSFTTLTCENLHKERLQNQKNKNYKNKESQWQTKSGALVVQFFIPSYINADQKLLFKLRTWKLGAPVHFLSLCFFAPSPPLIAPCVTGRSMAASR